MRLLLPPLRLLLLRLLLRPRSSPLHWVLRQTLPRRPVRLIGRRVRRTRWPVCQPRPANLRVLPAISRPCPSTLRTSQPSLWAIKAQQARPSRLHAPLLASCPLNHDTCGVRQRTFSTSARRSRGKSTCSPPVSCATASRRWSRPRSARRGSTTPPRACCTSTCARWSLTSRASCCSSRTWVATSSRRRLQS